MGTFLGAIPHFAMPPSRSRKVGAWKATDSMGELKMKFAIPLGCCGCLFLIVIFYLSLGWERELSPIFDVLPSQPMDGDRIHSNCYVPEGSSHCAPQFIIAGAMKSGTTSMYNYLQSHPSVLPLRSHQIEGNTSPIVAQKEARFFNDPTWTTMLRKFGQKGAVQRYLYLFPEISPTDTRKSITGEATPLYLAQPGVATRIRDILPEVKNILLLRNPLERSYSEFWFKQTYSGNSVQHFEAARLSYEAVFSNCIRAEMNVIDHCRNKIADDGTAKATMEIFRCYHGLMGTVKDLRATDHRCSKGARYEGMCVSGGSSKYCQAGNAWNSLYGYQLREWTEQFPREQLMIIPSESLYKKSDVVMEQVASYLGLSPFEWEQVTGTRYNIAKGDSTFARNEQVVTRTDIDATNALKRAYPPLSPDLENEFVQWFQSYDHLLHQFEFGHELISSWRSY